MTSSQSCGLTIEENIEGEVLKNEECLPVDLSLST